MPVLLEMELFKPEIPVSLLTEKDIPFFLPNPNINAEYEKKMDKLRAKQDRDASFMWQRIAIEKAKLKEGAK